MVVPPKARPSNIPQTREMDMTRTIFITGTTSGFGKATVELFAKNGWNVAATSRQPDMADVFAAYPNVKTYQLDVTDDAAVERVAAEAIADFGSVDVLVNNAGYCLMGSLEASTMEQVRRQFDTNTFGLIAVTKAFLPHLRARGQGMVFNVASSSALANFPFVSVYGASKWAVRGISESLFIELAPFGIKVKTIYPGLHATQIFTKLDNAVGPGREAYAEHMGNFLAVQGSVDRGGDSEQVARTIWAAVEKNDDRRDYIVNRDAKVLAFLKRWLSDAMWKRMNLGTILNPPSRALLAMTKWQINGAKPLSFAIDPRMTERAAGAEARA